MLIAMSHAWSAAHLGVSVRCCRCLMVRCRYAHQLRKGTGLWARGAVSQAHQMYPLVQEWALRGLCTREKLFG